MRDLFDLSGTFERSIKHKGKSDQSDVKNAKPVHRKDKMRERWEDFPLNVFDIKTMLFRLVS